MLNSLVSSYFQHSLNPLHAGVQALLRGHHCKSSIGQLGSEFGLARFRVLNLAQKGGKSDAVVAWLACLSGILHAELTLTRAASIRGGSCLEESSCLNQTSEGNDLGTAKGG